MKAGADWVGLQEEDVVGNEGQMEKDEITDDGPEEREDLEDHVAWANYDGHVPVVKAPRSVLRWRATAWWRTKSAWGVRVDPMNVSRWKHTWGFHDRGVVWDAPTAQWGARPRRTK